MEKPLAVAKEAENSNCPAASGDYYEEEIGWESSTCRVRRRRWPWREETCRAGEDVSGSGRESGKTPLDSSVTRCLTL